jgi:hypothetical protein
LLRANSVVYGSPAAAYVADHMRGMANNELAEGLVTMQRVVPLGGGSG